MSRVQASLFIPREDVYHGVVKPAKDNQKLSKLLVSLLEVYHDFPEVRALVESSRVEAAKQSEGVVDNLVDRMKAKLAEAANTTSHSRAVLGEAQREASRFGESVSETLEGTNAGASEGVGVSSEGAGVGGESGDSLAAALRESTAETREGNKVTHALLTQLLETLTSGAVQVPVGVTAAETVSKTETPSADASEAPKEPKPVVPIVLESDTEIADVDPQSVDVPVDSGVVADSPDWGSVDFSDEEDPEDDSSAAGFSMLDALLQNSVKEG